MRRVLALVVAAVVLAGGCSGPILANPPLVFPSPVPPSPGPSAAGPDPIPISFPRDDGPHGRLTEWWYYTGHLRARSHAGSVLAERPFGFEAVVFRAERGSVPVAWASHLALTNEIAVGSSPPSFHYAQRSEVGPQADRSARDSNGEPTGFDLQVAGLSPSLIAAGVPPVAATPWRLAGSGGHDRIEAALAPEEAAAAGTAFGLALDLEPLKAPALHDGDGFVDFGAGGSSYYYSRTRLAVDGTLTFGGTPLEVEGIAWFDHQWGDFISVGGGWDWYAVNLDDGTDVTVSVVYLRGGGTAQYGTAVDPDGTVRHLPGEAFGVRPTTSLPSPTTDRIYPSDWIITIPDFRDGEELRINLTPTLANQELDARPTTGVVYWEGSQSVSATLGLLNATSLGGEAYVEMTRY